MADVQSKMSFGEGISPERRKSEFGLVTVPARSGAAGVISLALPKDWKQIPEVAPPPNRRPGWEELASFAPSNSVSVTLFQVAQRYEVNLRDWLEYQAWLLKITLTAAQLGETEFGPMVHASGAGEDGERMRLVVAADGKMLFFLICRAARGEPADMDEILGLTAASFLFQTHSGQTLREKLNEFADRAQTFKLLYPESWTAVTRSGTKDQIVVDFRVSDASDTLAYLCLTVPAVPAGKSGDLQAAFEAVVQNLTDAGITIEQLDPIPAGANGGERERWLGTCRLPAGEGQVALHFRRGKFGWMSAVMLSPGKERNPMIWMRAKRFYEILTASLSGGLSGRNQEAAV